MLDESSVWNELIKLADLDKGDMKKLSADEMCAMIGESSKQIMGAVETLFALCAAVSHTIGFFGCPYLPLSYFMPLSCLY